MATFLDWTVDQLMHKDGLTVMTKAPQNSEGIKPANVPPPEFGEKNVPIMGLAYGGARGGFQMSNDAIDYAPRPPALINTKNLYAIFVNNDSMAPAYESGALVYVSPDRPARAGDYVIVQLKATRGDQEALFKRLKKADDKGLVLEQYNPPKDIKIAQADVVALHRVYTFNELVGF